MQLQISKVSLMTNVYTCIDSDRYDGAPDAAAEDRIVGQGSTPREAVQDWLDQTNDEYLFD